MLRLGAVFEHVAFGAQDVRRFETAPRRRIFDRELDRVFLVARGDRLCYRTRLNLVEVVIAVAVDAEFERTRALEFGIYRDGDNNLDQIQSRTITQAVAARDEEHAIQFTIEDTTSRRGFEPAHVLRTESDMLAAGAQ